MTDYNCGARTYDGHQGTDIGIAPFSFYKMDHNQVEVVAAAAGVLLDKADGNFDRNCAVNSLPANYAVVQHPDGSRAFYWHLKKNSVTTKAIGQPVAAGEYLGVVGSSGSSSGPHLHFEVRSGSTTSTRVDPFAGACNGLKCQLLVGGSKAVCRTGHREGLRKYDRYCAARLPEYGDLE
ncbi:MAG: peptidoglycan DD-metalloendopeptidase family protein [Saprospirales bacterium]|nr:peptidoglycan DD-metalloendopeptidase family protein [Saprospirales bacterium]